MRIRQVDVAAPDPFAAIAFLGANEPSGLRIVDDEEVFDELHALSVLLVVHQEDVKDLLGRVIVASVQRVVESLGDFEEIVAAGNNLPLSLDFELLHERYEP